MTALIIKKVGLKIVIGAQGEVVCRRVNIPVSVFLHTTFPYI